MKIALPNGETKEIAVNSVAIEDILKKFGINPVEVVVAKNGKIVSEYEVIDSGDELKIIRIVHGG